VSGVRGSEIGEFGRVSDAIRTASDVFGGCGVRASITVQHWNLAACLFCLCPIRNLLSGVSGSMMCEPFVAIEARVPQRGILVASERKHRLGPFENRHSLETCPLPGESVKV